MNASLKRACTERDFARKHSKCCRALQLLSTIGCDSPFTTGPAVTVAFVLAKWLLKDLGLDCVIALLVWGRTTRGEIHIATFLALCVTFSTSIYVCLLITTERF